MRGYYFDNARDTISNSVKNYAAGNKYNGSDVSVCNEHYYYTGESNFDGDDDIYNDKDESARGNVSPNSDYVNGDDARGKDNNSYVNGICSESDDIGDSNCDFDDVNYKDKNGSTSDDKDIDGDPDFDIVKDINIAYDSQDGLFNQNVYFHVSNLNGNNANDNDEDAKDNNNMSDDEDKPDTDNIDEAGKQETIDVGYNADDTVGDSENEEDDILFWVNMSTIIDDGDISECDESNDDDVDELSNVYERDDILLNDITIGSSPMPHNSVLYSSDVSFQSNADLIDNQESLKFTSLNVCGLLSKLKHPDFITEINKYDVVGLSETKMDDLDDVDVNGYTCFAKCRLICKRRSGGVALLVRTDLLSRITITENESRINRVDTAKQKYYNFVDHFISENCLFF